ncbi:hypothetical protein CEXT_207741 [Caerostris extrusa]|uniref:Uncharacterized protein n=1 Tax=Caerostris extrusa TaxID=172846 RepID=A0AAV4Q563_CAEEX|nr:hypothetical protein CEXT_207741 [Caerostris extrusa]
MIALNASEHQRVFLCPWDISRTSLNFINKAANSVEASSMWMQRPILVTDRNWLCMGRRPHSSLNARGRVRQCNEAVSCAPNQWP